MLKVARRLRGVPAALFENSKYSAKTDER